MKSKEILNVRQFAKWSRVFLAVLLYLIAFNIQAQTTQITGTVTDASTSMGIPGVGVNLKGTSISALTDFGGKFTIDAPSADGILVVTFIGYQTQEIPISGQTNISIALEPEVTGLDEVVVIGYGSLKKGDVTSSVSSVKSDDFVKGSVKDAGQLIQGKVAGLSISTPSGNPSEGTQIMLRGNTTLSAGTSPLVLIDGIPGNLNTVAPEDIEAIDVLKDGSAAAIYGTRGTNGVIIITTKKYKGDKASMVEYNSYVSIQTIARQAEFLDASDYRTLIALGYSMPDDGYSTDWLGEVTRNPISQMHSLSLKGGSAKTNYVATITYNQTQGLFKKSDDNKINARLEINHSFLNDMIRLSGGVTAGYNNNFNVYPYRQALIHNPTSPITNTDGSWYENEGVFQYENPVSLLEETLGENKNQSLLYHGSILFEPIKGLRFKLQASTTHDNFIGGYAETKKHISTIRDGRNGYASRSSSSYIDNLAEFTAEYNKTIGKHGFTVLGGYSYNHDIYEYFSEENWDFPTDVYSYNNMGKGDALKRGDATMYSIKNMSKLIGFFGRVNYNFAEKYLLMASIRREGSSKFGTNYKWGSFPAVSVGWRISNESFFENISFIDDLKLRAGYGITGTEPNDPYLSLIRLKYEGYFLVNGKWVPQILPASNANPDLRWEKKLETNIGLDFSVLKGRINGSVDYYIRQTKDLLWNYQVPSPPYLYPTIIANVGEIENKGLEVLINVSPIKNKDFEWIASLSYSNNKNKLVSLSNELYETSNDWFEDGYTGDPIQQSTHRIQIGGPIGNFWGVRSIDIDEDGVWIIEGADGNPKSIVDKTEEDKQVLGNGLPKYYLGFNNTIRYKNFDLNITMRGAFGFQILNFQRLFYENPTINSNYNRLRSAYDLVYGKELLNYTQEYVSYYIEDGDYWKIDNITFGYNFKLGKVFQKARVYASCLNLATFTGYKGIDPEVNRIGLSPGNDDRDKYPTTRTFSFGLNLTF